MPVRVPKPNRRSAAYSFVLPNLSAILAAPTFDDRLMMPATVR